MAADRGVDGPDRRHPSRGRTLDLEELDRRLSDRGRSSWRSATPRTRWARSTRSPRSSAGPTRSGALTYVDAVHFAPHGPIDVQALDTDFLVCSVYKFFGPHLGALYGKEAVLDGLPAERYKVRPAHDRFETGTQNFEGDRGRAGGSRVPRVGRRALRRGVRGGVPGLDRPAARAQDRHAGDPGLRDGAVRAPARPASRRSPASASGAITDRDRLAAERTPTAGDHLRGLLAPGGGRGARAPGDHDLGRRLLRPGAHRAARPVRGRRRAPDRASRTTTPRPRSTGCSRRLREIAGPR